MQAVLNEDKLVKDFQHFLSAQHMGNAREKQVLLQDFKRFVAWLPDSFIEATEGDYHRYYAMHATDKVQEAHYRESLQAIANFQADLLESAQDEALTEHDSFVDSSYSGLLRRFSASDLDEDNTPMPKLSTGLLNQSLQPLSFNPQEAQGEPKNFVKPHRRRENNSDFQFPPDLVGKASGLMDAVVEAGDLADRQTPHAFSRPVSSDEETPERALHKISAAEHNALRAEQMLRRSAQNDALTPDRKLANISSQDIKTPPRGTIPVDRQRARTIEVSENEGALLDFFATNIIAKDSLEEPQDIATPDHSMPSPNKLSAMDIINERNDPILGMSEPDVSFSRLNRFNAMADPVSELEQVKESNASLRRVEGISYDFSSVAEEDTSSIRDSQQKVDLNELHNVKPVEEAKKAARSSFMFENKYPITMGLERSENFSTRKMNPFSILGARLFLNAAFYLFAIAIMLFLRDIPLLQPLAIVFGVIAVLLTIVNIPFFQKPNQTTPISALAAYTLAIQKGRYTVAYRLLATPMAGETIEDVDWEELEPLKDYNHLCYYSFAEYWKHFPFYGKRGLIHRWKSALKPLHPHNTRTVLGSINDGAVLLLFEDPKTDAYYLVPVVQINDAWYLANGQLFKHTLS